MGMEGGSVIELPWPPKELNPNRRCHYMAKARKTKEYRQACGMTGIAEGLRRRDYGDGDIPIRFDFFPPDNRRRDQDNLIASMKAAQDGLADAMGVNDSRFVPTYKLHPKPEGERGGYVRVTI